MNGKLTAYSCGGSSGTAPWSLPDSLFPRLGAGTVDHGTLRRWRPFARFRDDAAFIRCDIPA